MTSLSVEDRLNIQELASIYACAMDTNDMGSWISTWSPEGIWEGPRGIYTGTEQLLNLIPDLGARVQGKRHIITNHIIRETPTGASMTCYMLVLDAKAGGNSVTTATYHDDLVKIGGRWLFAKRVMKIDGM